MTTLITLAAALSVLSRAQQPAVPPDPLTEAAQAAGMTVTEFKKVNHQLWEVRKEALKEALAERGLPADGSWFDVARYDTEAEKRLNAGAPKPSPGRDGVVRTADGRVALAATGLDGLFSKEQAEAFEAEMEENFKVEDAATRAARALPLDLSPDASWDEIREAEWQISLRKMRENPSSQDESQPEPGGKRKPRCRRLPKGGGEACGGY